MVINNGSCSPQTDILRPKYEVNFTFFDWQRGNIFEFLSNIFVFDEVNLIGPKNLILIAVFLLTQFEGGN